MLFSELFGIKKIKADDWFDPILTVDTKLFIDPFLLFQCKEGFFVNSHTKIIVFFQRAFELAAKSGGNTFSLSYNKLLSILSFPEASELCLGFAGSDTDGAGSGPGFSINIASVMIDSIGLGIRDMVHFEEMSLLGKGIGRDRISDIAANILKRELIDYTLEICKRHKIPTQRVRVRNSDFNFEYLRWESNIVELPINPFTERPRPILLVPEKVLRHLSTINSEDFLTWAWENENFTLRNDLNFEVKSKIRKEDIINIARNNPSFVEKYVEFNEGRDSIPYDLEKDIYGFYKWYEQSKKFRDSFPFIINPITGEQDLPGFVEALLRIFETFIIDNSGYKLLWNEGIVKKPKIEEASQLLFLGVVKHYCYANNIDISREVDIGRGPVDFKFTEGFQHRVLLEVKRASNSKFYDGLQKQLLQYLKGEGITHGFYMVIVQKDDELDKAERIKQLAEKISEDNGAKVKAFIIDARDNKPSASKL
ncbi:hypothetical protein [Cohnella herbarum]|uniref:Uncharacterized protein n=1 Tax=Cohnella herbarum TaxID=2728023 RepID=A0A7Z2ZPW1_9BACL|nr:hypothetical protein [Cohnella herbarum]QJD87604.1 hypothetical protein HH215_33430 [Cohnella herbarum]